MKKNDVFTFNSQAGVEVTAVVLHVNKVYEDEDGMMFEYICYAQNRLFTYYVKYGDMPVERYDENLNKVVADYQTVVLMTSYGEIIVDYAVLSDYDDVLENYKPNEG